MDIQGIGSMQGMQGMRGMMGMGMRQPPALTEDQQTQIQTILSEYDSENLTSEDAQSIFEQFRSAGIAPGKGMKEAIEAAGFDAEELRSLGMQGMQGMQGVQGGGMRPEMRGMESGTLTEDQKSRIQTILSAYDAENLTAEDAKSIFEQFRKAGIVPGKGMKETIEAAGFDAEQLRSLGMPQQNSQDNLLSILQNSTQGINASTLQSLQSILNQYDFSNLSSNDEKSLVSQLRNAGLMQSGSVFNIGI